MKKGSTLFLKIVLLFIGFGTFALMLRFPQTEGRAANLDLISIYSDPLIIYLYIASIPFYIGIYQAFKILTLVEKNKVFSQAAVDALRNIKYCALAVIGFTIGAMLWILTAVVGDDDPAGAIAMGIVINFASAVIATAAGVAQKLLQKAVDLKSENDLTV